MKGITFIEKLQDNEISSSSEYIDNIQDNDNIELYANRLFVNGEYKGEWHYE